MQSEAAVKVFPATFCPYSIYFYANCNCPLISAVEEEEEQLELAQQLEMLSAATTEIYGRHIKRIISKRMRHKRVPD